MSMMATLIPLLVGVLVLASSIMLLSSSTAIRGTVLSVNLVVSTLLVVGIFSPWINCIGMMGSSNASVEGMVSKTDSTPIGADGCAVEQTSDLCGYNTCGADGDEPCPCNLNVQYVMTVESDGLVSICAYYNTTGKMYSDNPAYKTMQAEIRGSRNSSGTPSIDDDTLFDSDGNSTFLMFGSTAAGGAYCGATGHLVTTSLEAQKHDYIYIMATPTENDCGVGKQAVARAANPISKYEKNKDQYK